MFRTLVHLVQMYFIVNKMNPTSMVFKGSTSDTGGPTSVRSGEPIRRTKDAKRFGPAIVEKNYLVFDRESDANNSFLIEASFNSKPRSLSAPPMFCQVRSLHHAASYKFHTWCFAKDTMPT